MCGQSSEGEKEDPLVVVEDERNSGGFGDKERENQCVYDVEDMVESKGTEGEKDQLCVAEEEGNSGGVGVRMV